MSLPEVRALSYTEELAPLWDVWIHILEIGAECACWGAGGPGVPPLKEKGWEPAHSSAPFWGHLPPGGRHDGRAGENTRPYGDCGRKTAGAQCALLQERARETAPSSAPFGGTFPYPLCPFGTSSLPLLAFGHFPLTGGIGPLTRGVGPQGEGLGAGGNPRPYTTFTNGSIYKKRDRPETCPLKRRGETQFRRTFFCLLFFQEK